MPGTHVDVLVTYTDQDHPQPSTATVLQDVEVLAAGHQVQPDPSGKPVSVDVVTLLLAPEDAEKATLASEKGTIHFVLRNGGDHKQAVAPPVNLDALAALPSKSQPGIPAPRPRADHPAPKPWVVETMLGDKRSTASFY
jgi:pilus assembly protein CpaB